MIYMKKSTAVKWLAFILILLSSTIAFIIYLSDQAHVRTQLVKTIDSLEMRVNQLEENDAMLLKEMTKYINVKDNITSLKRDTTTLFTYVAEKVTTLEEETTALHEETVYLYSILDIFTEKFSIDTVRVTAYAPMDPDAVEGMCYEGDPNITASGAQVKPGITIAAGPDIPFGTKVYIEGIGIRTVEDRGSAIHNQSIDIAMQDRTDAILFGVQYRKVLWIDE